MNCLKSPVVPGKASHDEKEASQILDKECNRLNGVELVLSGPTSDFGRRQSKVEMPRVCIDQPSKSLRGSSKYMFSILLLALVLTGCATRKKPNEPQQWGMWSRVPGTSSYSARVAEEVRQPRIDEAVRQNINATVEALQGETNRTWPQEVALGFAKQAQREVGFPNKPIDMGSLLSSNPAVKAKAFKEAQKDFRKQDKDLAEIHKVSEAATKQGMANTKQDSSASVTWWKFVTGLKNFLNAHWFILLVSFVSIAFVSWKVLPIFFPYLGPIFGAISLFVGRLFRMTMKVLAKWTTKLTQAQLADSPPRSTRSKRSRKSRSRVRT